MTTNIPLTIFIGKDGHVYSQREEEGTVDLGYILQAPLNNLISLETDLKDKHMDTKQIKKVCGNQQTLTAMAAVTQCIAYREAIALLGLSQRVEEGSLSQSSADSLELIVVNLTEDLYYLPEMKVITKELESLALKVKQKRISRASFQKKIRHIVGEVVHLVNP